jgi:CRP/FNR family transcriptional regulator
MAMKSMVDTPCVASRRQANDILTALRCCPALRGLGSEHLHALAAAGQRCTFAPGEVLFAPKSPAGIHILAAGGVKVFILARESCRELLLWSVRPFDVVADVSALFHQEGTMHAQALEPTRTIHVPLQALLEVLRRHPELALGLLASLAEREQKLAELLSGFAFNNVSGRLASYLVGALEAGLPCRLEPNATIATAIGTVPEVVSRTLWQLHREGVIHLEGRTVTRVDRHRLKARTFAHGPSVPQKVSD